MLLLQFLYSIMAVIQEKELKELILVWIDCDALRLYKYGGQIRIFLYGRTRMSETCRVTCTSGWPGPDRLVGSGRLSEPSRPNGPDGVSSNDLEQLHRCVDNVIRGFARCEVLFCFTGEGCAPAYEHTLYARVMGAEDIEARVAYHNGCLRF